MYAITYLSGHCGLNYPSLGMRSNLIGHIVLTNIGTLGFDGGHAPLAPPMKTIGLICTGRINKKPVVMENDEIKIQSMI